MLTGLAVNARPAWSMEGTQGGRAMATGSAPLPPPPPLCCCCGCSRIVSSLHADEEEGEGSVAAAALAARVRRGPAAAAAAAAIAHAALRLDSNATRTCEETEGTPAAAAMLLLRREAGGMTLWSAAEVSGGFIRGFSSSSRPRAAALTETMTGGCCCCWEKAEEEEEGRPRLPDAAHLLDGARSGGWWLPGWRWWGDGAQSLCLAASPRVTRLLGPEGAQSIRVKKIRGLGFTRVRRSVRAEAEHGMRTRCAFKTEMAAWDTLRV